MRGEASHMPSVPAGGFQARAGYRSALIHLPILGNPLQVVCHDHVCHVIHHNGMTGAALLRVLVMKGFQHPFGRIPKRARSTLHLQQPLCEQKFFEEYVVFCRLAASRRVIAGRSGMCLSFGIHPQMTGSCLANLFREWGLQTGRRRAAQGPLGPFSEWNSVAAQGIHHRVIMFCM